MVGNLAERANWGLYFRDWSSIMHRSTISDGQLRTLINYQIILPVKCTKCFKTAAVWSVALTTVNPISMTKSNQIKMWFNKGCQTATLHKIK